MKRMFMRNWLSVLAVSLALAAGSMYAARADADGVRHTQRQQSILIHLGHSTDDIHSADMALHMGTNLAKHGARVTMFVDREGVRIADKRLPIADLTWGTDNVGTDYSAFLAAGGLVVVCPGCAANQGLTSERLREGAVRGTPDSVAALMLEADKVIDF